MRGVLLSRLARLLLRVLGALLLVAGVGACASAERDAEAGGAAARSEVRAEHHPEGTGRFYMGREIAAVMGHQGAGWLERPARETAELPGRIVKALDLKPSDVVADIGAGTGYLSFRISRKVPHGRVLAVDIQPELLDMIRARMERAGVTNIVPVLGTEADPNLPDEAVDVALMVDAYHEFAYPYEMMTHVARALKPGGRVVLVEYRGEDRTIPVRELHKMTEAQARREMQAVGLIWRETQDILPQQHLIVSEKPLP